ncbi:bis(5'-nucleosyl)-tetraphosphatase (symmetrical) YqeK [Acholeplasma sp. OttesenSCG-928-E16]|nr:bis(5'-nucleosyl)-tetraphosphatase (symmetrical) YqeK [Acholeplasma sp. OttesenSCG-928-E16]
MIKKIKKDIMNRFKNDQKRLDHILGVNELMLELSSIYGVSLEKASIAALFHDYTKNDSLEDQKKYLSNYLIKRYKDTPQAYHGFSAAKILEDFYHYDDSEVLTAIKYHVTGRKNMSKLGKILFVSDYSEKNRTHKEAAFVRDLAYQDLDAAYKQAVIGKINHVNQKGQVLDKNQVESLMSVNSNIDLLSVVQGELEDVKVKDLKIFDFEKTNPFYDYFIIATINDRQGQAAVSRLKKAIKNEIRHVEGKTGWILIDANSIIIHLFKEEERTFYGFDQKFLGVKRIK